MCISKDGKIRLLGILLDAFDVCALLDTVNPSRSQFLEMVYLAWVRLRDRTHHENSLDEERTRENVHQLGTSPSFESDSLGD